MSQEPLSTWGGYFTFTNQLGKDIVRGSATHWTTDTGAESLVLDGLSNDKTSESKSFVTKSGNTDRWSFTATLTDGSTYVVGEKHCDFETEDSGQTVKLQAIIKRDERSFYISMPKSSDCSTSF